MAKITLAEAAHERQVEVPTEADVISLLDNLSGILAAAGRSESGEQQNVAREIVRRLTGGKILLYQQGERKAQRGWLQGRCVVRLLDYLVEQATGAPPAAGEHPGIEVTIDFRKPRPSEAAADRAFELYYQQALCAKIAEQLGCSRSRVTKLLKDAHAARGLEMPDGRSRRSTLDKKHIEPPLYHRLADPAKALWDDGLLVIEIAAKLTCDINTVTSAIRYWHESRGLPTPDGRSRRKELKRKSSKPPRLPDAGGCDSTAAA